MRSILFALCALVAVSASASFAAPKKKPAAVKKAPAPPPEPEPAPPAAEPEPPPAPTAQKPPSRSGKVKIAAPGLTAINLDPKLVEFYADHLAQRLGFAGVAVVSQKEIQGVLGLERQRQLLGCGAESSCMTELAGALGVDGLLVGTLAKVADTFQLNLKVISAGDASTLCSYAVKADEEEVLLKQLNLAAKEMARELYQGLGRGPAPEPVSAEVEATSGKVRKVAWVPAVLGGAFAITGVITLVLTEQQARVLHPTAGTVSLTTAQAAAAQGATFQTLSVVAFALTGACALTSVGMFVFGGPSGAFKTSLRAGPLGVSYALGRAGGTFTASVVATPLGGAFSLGGSF